MSENNFTTLSITKKTSEELEFISRITGMPKATLLERIIDNLFSLACNYDVLKDYASFSIYYSLSEGACHILLRGYPKIQVGLIKTTKEATEEECDKLIEKEMCKKITKDLAEAPNGNNPIRVTEGI